MNILIVNTLYFPEKVGGAEISVQDLAEGFSSLGINVGVLTLGENKDKFYNINNVAVWSLKIENNFWPFSTGENNAISKLRWHINDIENKNYDKKIKNIFEQFKPDILFTNNLSGFSTRIWNLAKSKNIKILHTIRDYYLQCPKTTKFKNSHNCITQCVSCKMLTSLKKNNSYQVDYLVGISDFVLKDHLKEGYFKNVPNEVIYNGFKFNFKPKKTKCLRDDKISFGYIGQINKEKGVELMLKSFLGLDYDKEKWELLIAGKVEKEYHNYLKGINNSKNIVYVGYADRYEFFKKIDVLIVPSLWQEPFGRVVLEAMINNKIVITNKTGGMNEIMENNKDLIFNSYKELNKLIKNIINNRDGIVFNNTLNFMSKFKIENIINKYCQIFSKLH